MEKTEVETDGGSGMDGDWSSWQRGRKVKRVAVLAIDSGLEG